MATLSQAPQATPAPAPAPAPPATVQPPVVAGLAPTPVVGFCTQGPWVAGALYVVVPTAPLLMVAEDELEEGTESPTWYCITRGHYIGVTTSNALAINAVVGVPTNTMKGHKTQAKAVAAFNELLSYHMVTVIA
ncbi:hypothetical protein B0H13DRAFT_2330064 [Mycena leptocephala]|nr:hypothetical protein B0H13DRAFT_2330064 [Mycena leptocephala]